MLYSLKEYRLFGEAWFYILLARLSLLCFPFKTIALWMQKNTTEPAQQLSIVENYLGSISTAIERASRYSPWRAMCFEQALCARKMLSRRKIRGTIYFGVRKKIDDSNIEAHAWVKVQDTIITGGKQTNTYQVLHEYA
jgi:hypothetical protein